APSAQPAEGILDDAVETRRHSPALLPVVFEDTFDREEQRAAVAARLEKRRLPAAARTEELGGHAEIRERRREADPGRPDTGGRVDAMEDGLQLAAALGPDEGVQFVDHNEGEPAEETRNLASAQ